MNPHFKALKDVVVFALTLTAIIAYVVLVATLTAKGDSPWPMIILVIVPGASLVLGTLYMDRVEHYKYLKDKDKS